MRLRWAKVLGTSWRDRPATIWSNGGPDKPQRATRRALRASWLRVKTSRKIYGLGEATLFDEFLYFLETLGVTPLLPTLDPHRTQRASNVDLGASCRVKVPVE